MSAIHYEHYDTHTIYVDSNGTRFIPYDKTGANPYIPEGMRNVIKRSEPKIKPKPIG